MNTRTPIEVNLNQKKTKKRKKIRKKMYILSHHVYENYYYICIVKIHEKTKAY